MGAASNPAAELERRAQDYAARRIPVLARTVAALARIKADEEAAHPRDVAHAVLRDPMLTLMLMRHLQTHRSRRQLEKKIVIGYLAYLIAHPNDPKLAYHWRDLYEEIRAGKALDADRLRQIACNYGLRRADWQPADAVPLVSDPIIFASELRYRADADLDTLQLLMRFCERVIGNR